MNQSGRHFLQIPGKVFRIGHLGDFNELMLLGTLGGVEMGFELSGVPYQSGGVQAAMDSLSDRSSAENNSRQVVSN